MKGTICRLGFVLITFVKIHNNYGAKLRTIALVSLICMLVSTLSCTGIVTIWYPDSTKEPSLFVQECAQLSLCGIGSSTESAEKARDNAIHDIDHQLAEVISNHIIVETMILTTGDVVQFKQMIISESEAVFGSLWEKVEKSAYSYSRDKSRLGWEKWTYYIYVPFRDSDSEQLIKQARTRIDSRLGQLQNLIETAELAIDEGNFRDAVELLASVYVQGRGEWKVRESDLTSIAGRLLSGLVATTELKVLEQPLRDCAYDIKVVASNFNGRAMAGVPLHAEVVSGEASIQSNPAETRPDGSATFRIRPGSRAPIDFKFGLHLEHLVEAVAESKSDEQHLLSKIGEMDPHTSWTTTLNPQRLVDHFDFSIEVIPQWEEITVLYFWKSWRLSGLTGNFSARGIPYLSEKLTLLLGNIHMPGKNIELGNGLQLVVLNLQGQAERSERFSLNEYVGPINEVLESKGVNHVQNVRFYFAVKVSSECEWATRRLDRAVNLSAPNQSTK